MDLGITLRIIPLALLEMSTLCPLKIHSPYFHLKRIRFKSYLGKWLIFRRYLMLAVLSPEDRERTHVFSTFFYKRLTSPPGKSMRASHPVESDPTLSPAQKRHARVKSWTKNINLFTKDFIIIPINEK